MNERIEALAKQAGYYQEQDVDGSRFDAMPRQCFEKFAELIIRKCGEHISNFGPNGDRDQLFKQFGIE